MKKPLMIIPLVFLLCFVLSLCTFLFESTPLYAKEWTAEQKDVLKWLKKYTEVSKQGNLEEIMSYFHSEFTGWDYAQQLPSDKDFVREFMDDYLKKYKMISFEIEPIEIKFQGSIAIVHVNYKEVLRDSSGSETSLSGRWTACLVKQDTKWLFLSWSWVEI